MHWAHGNNTPSWPLSAENCTFTTYNNAPVNVDIDIKGENFTAVGYTWTLGNLTGADTFRMRVGTNGTANEAAMLNLISSGWQEFMSNVSCCGNSTKWEAVITAPSFYTDDATVNGKIYLSARVVS